MPPAAAQMGPEFYVREASGLLHGPYPQPPAVPAGYEVVELAPHAQRAEEVRDGGPYFIACSDGQTRGPFGGADVVRLVAQGLAEKGAKCALGRRVATGASSSSSTKKPWTKHLRVHRWRATRFVAKQAKKGAVQTFQAAATAAPPQIYKTWADEEAEWAKEVVKQQSTAASSNAVTGTISRRRRGAPEVLFHTGPSSKRKSLPKDAHRRRRRGRCAGARGRRGNGGERRRGDGCRGGKTKVVTI